MRGSGPRLRSELSEATGGPRLQCVEQKNFPAEPTQPSKPGQIINCHYFKQSRFRVRINKWLAQRPSFGQIKAQMHITQVLGRAAFMPPLK